MPLSPFPTKEECRIQEPVYLGEPKGHAKSTVLFYYPDFGALGGIERFIHQTTQLLKKRGSFKPVVACSAGTPFYHQLKDAGIPVHGIRTFPWFARPMLRVLDLPTHYQLKQILAKEQPDIVHLHIGQQENLLFKQLGYPVVYSFHGYGSLYSLSKTGSTLKHRLKKLAQKGFIRSASQLDALLFVSGAERDRMIQEGYLAKEMPTEVLHNGLSVHALQQQVQETDPKSFKQALGIPQDGLCVGFINRLDENKNPLGFIELAEYLSIVPELPPLWFLIAGEGPMADKVRARIQVSPARERILMLGHRSDVPALLSSCDLVVHIPFEEGFGFGVLEAMATGTPCLAHRTGGIPEILGIPEATEVLVPVGDFRSLAQQALKLLQLTETERGHLTAQLQKRAMVFDISHFIERLEAVYARLLP